MAWMAITIKVVLGVVGALAALAGFAYAADYGIEATITSTHCSGATPNPFFPHLAASADSSVDVKTRLFGLTTTVDLDRSTCLALRPNNFVVYHVRSGHTTLYEDGSKTNCLYDSTTGTPC